MIYIPSFDFQLYSIFFSKMDGYSVFFKKLKNKKKSILATQWSVSILGVKDLLVLFTEVFLDIFLENRRKCAQ